jgi:opacity protein-like surface antigen
MIYMLGAAMDGTVTVGPVAGDVDVSFSDIMSNLELGGMASYRGERGDFAVLGDVIFMGLGATKAGAHDSKVDVDVDQWMVEVDAAWRLGPAFELVAGARYASLAADVSVRGLIEDRQGDTTKEWVDPVVGLQVRTPLGRGWDFVGRADVGGFGVGSEFAWQAVAGVRVALSPGSSLLLAYRAIDVDYESGSGADYFRYDMLTQGPMVGFSLKL